ncbi:hypothetical protein [Paraburkholderia sp. 40]|uniref:hypothetical protein n=1 Tax=Paraburkholderia sp. 40 TaxID=2991059 RepID=UPI003D196BDB
MQTTLKALPIAVLISAIYGCGGGTQNTSTTAPQGTTSSTPATTTTPSTSASNYTAGNLLVSRTAYDPAFALSGTLPYNATPTTTNAAPVTAVTPGTFPNVFTNDANDANFGVTSEAYLDQWAPNATSPSQTLDITAQAAKSNVNFATSFASKSELALNVSLDQKSLTFTGYNTSIDQADISNSNTPGVVDTTNTDVATPTYRTVAQLNFADNSLSFTNTNAYAGNNSRAAVLANGMYYIVGNAGNSGKNPKPTTAQLDMLTMNTGVQSIAPGSQCAFTQVIGGIPVRHGHRHVRGRTGGNGVLAGIDGFDHGRRQLDRRPVRLLDREPANDPRDRRRQNRQGRQPARPLRRPGRHDVCLQGQRRQRREHRVPGRRDRCARQRRQVAAKRRDGDRAGLHDGPRDQPDGAHVA